MSCLALSCAEAVGEELLSAMQGLVGLLTNPVIANGVAGLATSATAQATVQVPCPQHPTYLRPPVTRLLNALSILRSPTGHPALCLLTLQPFMH